MIRVVMMSDYNGICRIISFNQVHFIFYFVDFVLLSMNVAAEKNLGRCMLDCGGKKIEPGYTSNTCERNGVRKVATGAF